jgi:hypothetical protein
MLFQTFSAEEGRWGAVREASLLSDHPHPVERVCTSSPAVIGRTPAPSTGPAARPSRTTGTRSSLWTSTRPRRP